MSTYRNKIQKSFTVIEVVLAVGIFTLVVGAACTLLLTGRFSVNSNESLMQNTVQARNAFERMGRELRLSHANKVWISNNLNATNQLTSGSVVNFQVPVGSLSSELDLTADNSLRWGSLGTEGHFLAYSVDGNHRLLRTVYADANGANPQSSAIASGVSSITFSRTSTTSALVRVAITVQNGGLPYTFRTSVKLRND